VVGGFAVIIHGFPRTTLDIDLVVDVNQSNIKRLKNALIEVFQDELVKEISLEDINRYAVIRYGTPEGFYIDIIGRIGEIADYKSLSKDIEFYEFLGVRIPVCGLKSLIKIKETVRPKNKIDIEFLKEKLRKITESKKN